MSSRSLYLRRGIIARHRFVGLVANWKADTLGLANNANVTSWPDSSGQQNPITATGTALTFKTAQQNSLPTVTVAASSAAALTMATPQSQPITILAALKLPSAALSATIIKLGGTNAARLFLTGTAWDMNNGTDLVRGTTDTAFHIVAMFFSGASSYLRIDGVQQGTTGNAGSAGIDTGAQASALIGGSTGYALGEIAVYTGPFPTAAETALRTKWGTA